MYPPIASTTWRHRPEHRKRRAQPGFVVQPGEETAVLDGEVEEDQDRQATHQPLAPSSHKSVTSATVRYAQPIRPRMPHQPVRSQTQFETLPRNGTSAVCGSRR